jgi:hypothetical protein
MRPMSEVAALEHTVSSLLNDLKIRLGRDEHLKLRASGIQRPDPFDILTLAYA